VSLFLLVLLHVLVLVVVLALALGPVLVTVILIAIRLVLLSVLVHALAARRRCWRCFLSSHLYVVVITKFVVAVEAGMMLIAVAI